MLESEQQQSKNHHEPASVTKVRGTFLVSSRHGNGPSSTFVHCNSPDPYMPYRNPYKCPVSVNQSLNLHLGLPFNPRNITLVRMICHFFSQIFEFIEMYFFQAWESIPLRTRQSLTVKAWYLYLPLHRFFFKNKTAIHKHASYEYHALSTIMYWGRMFPVSIQRIRFSLSQLAVWHGPDVYPKNSLHVVCHEDVDDEEKEQEQEEEDGPGNGMDRTTIRLKRKNVIAVEKIHHTTKQTKQPETLSKKLSQRESNRAVSGYYLHNPRAAAHDEGSNNNDQTSHDDACSDTSTKKVLFYLYGGAFLGGDAKGNVHYGIKLSQQCNMDVFIPQYGLLPEYHFLDALEDIIQAYAYLIETRGIHPKNVILFGISSGGGLVVRLLQRIVQVMSANSGSDKSTIVVDDRNRKNDDLLLQVPSGAVLMSPFVDYTTPKGSFKEYTVHDLVVNESVFEEGIPYFATLGNDKTRHDESPINRPLAGLPPLCIIVSEHECCYDQNIVLCNRARKEGVPVDLGVWKYMCHVWPVLTAFLPEARSAIDFVCEWIIEHQNGGDN